MASCQAIACRSTESMSVPSRSKMAALAMGVLRARPDYCGVTAFDRSRAQKTLGSQTNRVASQEPFGSSAVSVGTDAGRGPGGRRLSPPDEVRQVVFSGAQRP